MTLPSLRIPPRSLSALAFVVTIAACGGTSAPPPSPMPASATYQGDNLEPMVVDWQPEQRGELEASMRQGVIAVAYGSRGLRLLPDCRVDGSYSYLGMTRRERVIRLRSEDDVKANLPLGGLGVAASIGGDFHKGATLDIAMVMVGRVRSTRSRVTQGDLQGRCEGATHIIRGATLGAFAVDRGDASRARSAVEIFGVGAGAGTASASAVRVVDGRLESCEAALPDSPTPPSQCGAVIRIELLPLTTESASAQAPLQGSPEAEGSCPRPLVRADGICTMPRPGQATGIAECRYGDASGCSSACERGEPVSCWRLGHMYRNGASGLPRDPSQAAALFRRACESGSTHGCVSLGIAHRDGRGVAKEPARAAQLLGSACAAGDADGCANLGVMLRDGEGVPVNLPMAEAALKRACSGGRPDACTDIGLMALGMLGVQPDFPLARSYFKRACDGEDPAGCVHFGLTNELGIGGPKNVDLALETYRRACSKSPADCTTLAAMLHQGRGVVRGGPEPVALLKGACAKDAVIACAFVRTFVDPNQVIDRDLASQVFKNTVQFCKNGVARSCTSSALLLMSQGQLGEGQPFLDRGCRAGDGWACAIMDFKRAR